MEEFSSEIRFVSLLDASDADLIRLSDEGGLALDIAEMKRVQEYYRRRGRDPTDVELQSIGQAWSEHCCYKSSKVFLKEYLMSIDTPSVILRGDAGVVDFDEDHAYALRIESHNHPSAVEPYGGAATGIGGIIRDVLCMGAQPVALIDPLHFGPLDFPHEELPKGVKHPRYLFEGVVAGIRDYGNRIGIPTVSGSVCFHEGYLGNCIINVGCVGIAKKKNVLKNAVKTDSDVFILVGGRTGRDGIHGVTYASVELTEDMEEEWMGGAVQLGDPITKEPLIHACLEAAERGFLSGMKDLGGGGLSCVVGEMALAGGFGAEVNLEKVPLKEEGLQPWEIWISESQERMMLAVPPEKVDEVLHLFKLYDVLATRVGHVIRDKIVRVLYEGKKILELDLDFYTAGPEYCREYLYDAQSLGKPEAIPEEPEDYNQTILKLISSPNIASKAWVIHQYDHEVRGATVVKPLQGKMGYACHGDAAVIKPLEHTFRGLAIATATNPTFSEIDPFRGGMSAVDEACRNIVAVGGFPDSLTNCLNFGNPEKPDRLGLFRETVRGIGHVAAHLGLPLPSGNVSFYNETEHSHVPPTPVVLGVGKVPDVRRCVTSDLKEQDNPIFLIGETKNEMGGSEYLRIFGGHSGTVPNVNVETLEKSLHAVSRAINEETVASCHDVSHGGIAIAISEMALGGDVGAFVDLSKTGTIPTSVKMFSESNTRWLVEVWRGKEDKFLEIVSDVPTRKLGMVKGSSVIIADSNIKAGIFLEDLSEAWKRTIYDFMGGTP
ncbi:MAG: phosphoribosylformylglycinamidine synthase subunit PurL [Thermoplasmata archaeon]|nr:phosphoribosylformylglycinamidine synthase subunit PurL [Thermoplasmata archaeon]